ncbi:hypothetical protein BASA81_005481 [Batrachochytrium salamandrivorans]|nr:hypothetical protein BASA81_005481 [Batrachochytrium salamandrivorans]
MLLAPSLPLLPRSGNSSVARQWRQAFRANKSRRPTAQLAPGFVQANLVVLDRTLALDFCLFALRNPKACPLLDVCLGSESALALGSNLRRDLPQYRVWQRGELVREVDDVVDCWPNDAVAFLIGCSFSFDALLRPLVSSFSAQCESVPMYRTKVPNIKAGVFGGELVCSMRMVPEENLAKVVELTGKVPLAHGAPVAIGTQQAVELGITNLLKPDFGLAPPPAMESGLVPVFWACGVTPQLAIQAAKVDAITHAPGCMFITDVDVKDL